MEWLEITLVLEVRKKVDQSHNNTGICYPRMASQGSILRLSATVWHMVLRHWASQSLQRHSIVDNRSTLTKIMYFIYCNVYIVHY